MSASPQSNDTLKYQMNVCGEYCEYLGGMRDEELRKRLMWFAVFPGLVRNLHLRDKTELQDTL